MIFNYCPIEMLPYEACVNVTSTSSTLTEIPVGYNYFISSSQHSTTTYFKYTDSINGTVVGIDTNLRIVQALNTTNKTFALSDSNIFGTNTKPYIRLLCNNVKVETFFFATYGGTEEENGFSNFSVDDDGTTITVSSNAVDDGYVTLARYVTVSWTKDEVNTLCFGDGHPNDRWIRIWGYSSAYAEGHDTIVTDYKTYSLENYQTTIPSLSSLGSPYYKVAYHVNFTGESRWAPYSYFITNGTHKTYNVNGFYNETNIAEEIIQNSVSKTPELYIGPNSNIWGNNKAFYKTTGGNYILASSGVQLKTQWTY